MENKSSKAWKRAVAVALALCAVWTLWGCGRTQVVKILDDDLVVFGAYEQDNDIKNGYEPIEWIVLAKEGNKALLISKYALAAKPYNMEDEAVTWETCTLRQWLNSTFLSVAFSAEEQKAILTTAVSAEDNQDYGTDAGNATQDKIFLLSISEAERYFKDDDARMCAPTEYAIAQGAYAGSNCSAGGRAAGYWWLRSPGYNFDYAARVYDDGDITTNGYFVDYYSLAVRPALWIELGS